ncbi:MAG: hypothetical protein AAGA32_19705 [Pseudomonadota bacterium]
MPSQSSDWCHTHLLAHQDHPSAQHVLIEVVPQLRVDATHPNLSG